MKTRLLTFVIVIVAAVAGWYIISQKPQPAASAPAETKPTSQSEQTSPDEYRACLDIGLAGAEKAKQEQVSLLESQAKSETPTIPDFTAEIAAANRYGEQEKQRIEQWYTRELASLQARMEAYIQNLQDQEKSAWAYCQQRMNDTVSTTTKTGTENSYTHYDVSYVWGRPQIDSVTQTDSTSVEATHQSVRGNPAAEYNAAIASLRNAAVVTQQDFLAARARLDAWKQSRLADVENEVHRMKAAIELRRRQAQREADRLASDHPNLSTEIIGTDADNKRYAIVSGQLAHEGDKVNGYTIRKILADRVEYEKDGQTVTQKLN